jgi:hypothetical protein
MIPALVYDIETQDWTRFVIGATYDGQEVVFYDWRNARGLVDRVLATEGNVVAHNGGRFDHLWLLDNAQRAATARSNGQGLVEIKIGKTRLLDSARLYPMRLLDLTAGRKRSLADLCRCGEGCGGYCVIRRDAPARVMRRIKEYLAADVVELWDALQHMAGVAEDAGLSLGTTVGSTAWKSARAFLGLERATYDRNEWAFMRRGYYGGRVEVWKRASDRGHAADVHSMYPWALSAGSFPVDYLGLVRGSKAQAAMRRGRPGIYQITIDVPESFAPPLPYRVRSGVAFPHGRLVGVWASPEIEHAQDVGAKIVKVHAGAIFGTARPIFGAWVDRMFALRMRYGKGTREGKWLKLVLNSLTGKFGSKSVVRQIQLFPDPESLTICTCGRAGECGCGGSRPLDDTGRAFERRITPAKIDGCAHAPWAAYLTAMARVKLHNAIDESAVYGDTDSIFRETPLPRGWIGKDLGTWDDLGTYSSMRVLAPKVYRVTMRDPDTGRGKVVIAAKGIPAPTWEALASGSPVSWSSMAGVKRAGARGFFSLIEQTRTVTPNLGRRRPDGPVSTRAPHVDELRDEEVPQ